MTREQELRNERTHVMTELRRLRVQRKNWVMKWKVLIAEGREQKRLRKAVSKRYMAVLKKLHNLNLDVTKKRVMTLPQFPPGFFREGELRRYLGTPGGKARLKRLAWLLHQVEKEGYAMHHKDDNDAGT